MFGLGLIDGADGFDNGKDISYKGLVIDVKTMGRTVDVHPDIYSSLNKRNFELTVCGWISKSELFAKAVKFPKGSIRKRSDGTEFRTFSDLYEISNGHRTM